VSDGNNLNIETGVLIMTKSQEKMWNKIQDNFHDVQVTENEHGMVFVKFNNGKDHIYLHETAHVTIGKRGKVTFLDADRMGILDDKHRKVIAYLMGTKLGLGNNQVHFSKLF